jgi:Uma2 family endonuclease
MLRTDPLADPGSEGLFFPVEERVPESKRHLELRTLLYQILKYRLAARASIGCDQFVYWDPRNPKACLSPDGFVYLGAPDADFPSWKTWERGIPEIAIEILSESDTHEVAWSEKLDRYQALGVGELVRFDPEAEPGKELKIWRRLGQALCAAESGVDQVRSAALDAWLLSVPDAQLGITLRVADDQAGERLWLTRAESEAEARGAAQRLADSATRRIAELEAELRRLKGEP